MKFLTISELREIENKEFRKLYIKKLKEIEKQYDRKKIFL